MRNVFDQYTQPENRLTHSLACALDADPRLLRRFVKWTTGKSAPSSLKIVEQQLPGEMELEEEGDERLGLPDAWIHDNDSWSLLIESKVASKLSFEQLKRHHRTAKSRGLP